MDGKPATHSIERCYEVTEWVLKTVFDELYDATRRKLEGMILKPNMVIDGKNARTASVEQVAEQTVRLLKSTVPAAVAGIAFLSGWPVRRRSDCASFGDERELSRRRGSLRSPMAGRCKRPRSSAWNGKSGERCSGPTRLYAPRQDERPRRNRRLEKRPGKGGLSVFYPKAYLMEPGLESVRVLFVG